MARSLPAWIVPRLRPRRVAALLFPALLVTLAVGCGHHKRTSLRPVYVSPPAATAAPCPTGDCGGSAVPAGSSSTSAVDPAVIESGATGAGSILPAAPPTPAPPLRPVPTPAPSTSNTPSRASDTPPPVLGPPMPGFSDEPGLGPIQPENSSKVPAPGRQGTGAGTGTGVAPSASLKGGTGRKSAPGRLRSASLRDDLLQYTNDPDDLFAPPKADRPWKYIVLHHSAGAAGSYDSIDQEHRKRLGWQGCGYHFVIGNGTESPDGRIEVSQRWSNQKHGVHCRDGKAPDVSEYGIGICLVGDLETAPPTDRQIAAARALVAYLSDRYKIAPDHAETHAHLAAGPTSCPGKMFPTRAILGSKGLALR